MDHLEHTPGWKTANRAVWLAGTAIVAAYGVALLLYGPGIRAEAEEASHQQMMAEHGIVCDELGRRDGSPDREQCLTLLLRLQQRHEQTYAARTSSDF